MEHPGSLRFIDPLVLDDVVEEFALFHELHDEEELFRRFDDLVKLDDVRVPDQLQNMNFTRHTFHVCDLSNLAFFEDFYGYILVGRFMNC